MKLAPLSVVKILALELDSLEKERERENKDRDRREGKGKENKRLVENVGYQNEQNATNEEKKSRKSESDRTNGHPSLQEGQSHVEQRRKSLKPHL